MQQEGVTQRRRDGLRVVVGGGDRLLAEVAAGHHQRGRRKPGAGSDSRWCSGVYGNMTPSSRNPGATSGATGDPSRHGSGRSAARRRQRLLSGGVDLAQRASGVEVPNHHGERQRRGPCAGAAERTASGLVASPDGSRPAPYDRDDPALAQQHARRLDRVVGQVGPVGEWVRGAGRDLQAWPADRAGVRLRVETPVERVVIFRLAGRAHLERRHRRVGPVVGDVLNDGEARPAVRAVSEGVAIAPVGRIENLRQAVVARRHIRRYRLVRAGLRLTVADLEHRRAICRAGWTVTRSMRERRRFGGDGACETVQRAVLALDLDLDA